MRNSSGTKSRCSLCWSIGAGIRCEAVERYMATLVDNTDVSDMAAGMGNPMLFEVKQPEDDTKQTIRQWFEIIVSDELTINVQNLV
jgi:hypothetical protein